MVSPLNNIKLFLNWWVFPIQKYTCIFNVNMVQTHCETKFFINKCLVIKLPMNGGMWFAIF